MTSELDKPGIETFLTKQINSVIEAQTTGNTSGEGPKLIDLKILLLLFSAAKAAQEMQMSVRQSVRPSVRQHIFSSY